MSTEPVSISPQAGTPKSLTDAELAEVHKREQAATAGPWDSVDSFGSHTYMVVQRLPNGPPPLFIGGHFSHEANADFTAAARTDIPRLLATIAELKAILADCQQDSLAYLAGIREGRRQAVEEAREHCPPDCLLEGCRELPPGHYLASRYCDNCDRDTTHDSHDSGHERDSSQDYRKCLVCGFERWGM